MANQVPDVSLHFPPLPKWLAGRLLRPGEKIVWVYGPWAHPSWERYITHPSLFPVALVLGGLCVAVGSLLAQIGTLESIAPALSGFLAGSIVLGSIFALGISSGYFTRLVVTNFRLVILQGYEVCRGWSIENLPQSLVRYCMPRGGVREPSIDLDTLRILLGGPTDKVADSKSILSFGKQLDNIKPRENGFR
jgi:hypothetical protein